ncbi:MAG TPA: amidohydrolase [Terriglobales bacterium]|jgi:predicted amidohydrolase YtcJ|nr:amidohydrolase [Terriglobales bacterium]
MPTSRREFLYGLSSAAAFVWLPIDRSEPDLILYNANVWTVSPRQPRAQAIAISNGRFLASGTNEEILALAAGSPKKIDLGGKTVLPGFIDAHSHPAQAGLAHLRMVDCDLRSIADILKALRERAAKTPPGAWVLGFKYDDTKTAEGRPLTLKDLDEAVPDHPVFVEHRGGHTAWTNSLALKTAKVDENTPDPRGGKFDRDPSTGKLDGHVRETAKEFFTKLFPGFTREDHREGVKLISKMMSRTGITSVTDASGTPDDLRAYQDARDAGDLSVRVYCHIYNAFMDQMLAAGIHTGLGDEWVKVGAQKCVCDGSISERTARLSQSYIGRPNDFGILVTDEEHLYALSRKAHESGWQLGTHANGDVGIDTTLRVYERLQKEMPRKDPRYRLEHCTVINDSLVARIKALGAIPTPFSTYAYYHGEKMKEYGADRVNNMFALRTFLDAGIRPTQASDYPPGPFEPMMALRSEVTRTDAKGNVWGAKQRVSVEEAIRVGTINGAFASYEENIKGSIEPGKLADLVVLGQDPFKVDPMELINIPVERTMAGGKWVWES